MVLLLALGLALVQVQRSAAGSDALEHQVKEIAAQLRCPVGATGVDMVLAPQP